MLKKSGIIIFVILLVFFSCKKKDKVADDLDTTTTGGLVDNELYDGFFQTQVFAVWIDTTIIISKGFNPYVYLASKPIPSKDTYGSSGIKAGKVLVNGTQLKYANAFRYYDTTYALSAPPINFQLIGTDGFPSFTYNNLDSFPSFSNNYPNLIQDTLSKGANYSIPLTSLKYSGELKCGLFDVTNISALIGTSKTISKGATELIFTPEELSKFSPNKRIKLSIELKSYYTKSFGEKKFRFENIITLGDLSVYVKP
jgi:hypothetical protein